MNKKLSSQQKEVNYFAICFPETGEYLATGLNTNSLDDLAAEYRSLRVMEGCDEFEQLDLGDVLDLITADGFEVESQSTPFPTYE